MYTFLKCSYLFFQTRKLNCTYLNLSFQSTDDSRDYGTWDRQMVTEVAIEPQLDTKCPIPSQYPNPNQQPAANHYVPSPSPNQFLSQTVPGQSHGAPVSMVQGSSIRPQLIDTSALLHHLNWLQNNPNAQVNCLKITS